jgi:carbonic anhydrase
VTNTTNYSVIGLLFKINDSLENDILGNYNFVSDGKDHTLIFPFNIRDKMVYHYEGSLTTPPCS